MKIIEERCDIITNMEVMVLLVQQQQLLPSVDSLLRCASKPSSSNSGSTTQSSKSDLRSGSEREDGAYVQGEAAAERFRLDHVKDLLYRHMFNQMVQDYVRKTCPYLHLVRAPNDLRTPLDRSRNQPGMRNSTRRSFGCSAGSRRASGITALRHGGVSPLISRCLRECLDALVHRFGLTELELLTIVNLGAYKPVEIYVFLEDCSSSLIAMVLLCGVVTPTRAAARTYSSALASHISNEFFGSGSVHVVVRFTEDDAAAMLSLIDRALVQQQPIPPQPESATNAMDVESHEDPQIIGGTSNSELDALQQQQHELQEEARQLELQQQQVQQATLQGDGWPRNNQPTAASGHEEAMKQGAAPADGSPECSTSMDLFAPPNGGMQLETDGTSPAFDILKEARPRNKTGRTAAAKRRAPSRRKRVLDD